MNESDAAALGYACFWKRISLKLGLSEAARELEGVRASHLSAFEQNKPHPLTDEQIQAYVALLDRKKAESDPSK